MADPRLTEAHIQQTVREFLEADGWRAIRTEHALERTKEGKIRRKVGEVGMPDMLFVRYLDRSWVPADVMWIEFKRPGNNLTPSQVAWHETEQERGALIVVVDDPDWFAEWYLQCGLNRRIAR